MRNEVLPDLSEAAERCCDALAANGARPIARVIASKQATDLAFAAKGFGHLIVRCVPAPAPDDYHALATMLAQGDFTRAFIVYTAEDQPHLPGEIESYPLSRIDELAALLAKESPP
ncbi:MAG: hypothetical protein AB7T59_13495 [Hyphomonadaceae bacterium]